MAEPEYATTYTQNAKLAVPRAIPMTPDALKALAEASANYSAAAARFIEARHDLDDAKMNWSECRDRVAKATEQEGV